MCKNKMAVNASDPNSTRRTHSSQTRPNSTQSPRRTPSRLPTFPASSSSSPSSSLNTKPSTSASNIATSSSNQTASSGTSLSSLRDSISQNPHLYDISEIRSATNNFLSKPYAAGAGAAASSSSKCWRCNLRNADTLVFQRKFRRKLSTAELKHRLSVICRSHHVSVVKLLGASVSGDDYIYLVYEFINGANLSDCLRNRLNPNFTVLSSWSSRAQIAADIAHALDYIHHKTGLNLNLIHNYIKSTAILITDPSLNAKICHFGAAYLCGEIIENDNIKEETELKNEFSFEGVRGYMSPEFQSTGIPTRENDVYAFGVVVLELLSGEEPMKYRYDKERGDFVRTSLIETAREAVEGGEGTLRRWMDRRLRDSFPVEVVKKLVRLTLECVHVEADKRPNMGRVAGKVSKLYLESQRWSDALQDPNDMISVSLAVR